MWNSLLGKFVDSKSDSVIFHIEDDVIVWEKLTKAENPERFLTTFTNKDVTEVVRFEDVIFLGDKIWFITNIERKIREPIDVMIIHTRTFDIPADMVAHHALLIVEIIE